MALEYSNAHINPKSTYVNSDSCQNYGWLVEGKKYNLVVKLVEFDVAVHAEKGTEDHGTITINVNSIDLGEGETKQQEANSSESRIEFKIPFVFLTSEKKLNKIA